MKKSCMFLAALCAGMLFGAELPDFSKAENWYKASWTMSTYSAADGVMTIERTEDQGKGSGAWCSSWFEVKAGEKFSGSVDYHFISKSDSSYGRIGVDFYSAEHKRVQFAQCAQLLKLNNTFETVKFNCPEAPEGAVKARIFLCYDNFGKIEFKNVKFSR